MDDRASVSPIEILLVEDNPGDARLTREILRDAKLSNGLQVVPDTVEAWAFLRREGKYASANHPDLILLDLTLPHGGGREFLAELKEDALFAGIPVVVLTGSANPDDIADARSHEASGYVVKPLDIETFLGVVRDLEGFGLAVVRRGAATA